MGFLVVTVEVVSYTTVVTDIVSACKSRWKVVIHETCNTHVLGADT